MGKLRSRKIRLLAAKDKWAVMIILKNSYTVEEGLHSVANPEFLFRRGLRSGHQ